MKRSGSLWVPSTDVNLRVTWLRSAPHQPSIEHHFNAISLSSLFYFMIGKWFRLLLHYPYDVRITLYFFAECEKINEKLNCFSLWTSLYFSLQIFLHHSTNFYTPFFPVGLKISGRIQIYKLQTDVLILPISRKYKEENSSSRTFVKGSHSNNDFSIPLQFIRFIFNKVWV